MTDQDNSDDLGLFTLADFQAERVKAMQDVIARTVRRQDEEPELRDAIARKEAVMLLQSPTGSGKTLMLGRTIEGVVGTLPAKMVWFWFAPFSGLVEQTRDALIDQCPSLRLRDLTKDREPSLARDGDVYVHTWATVAANNKEARKVRQTKESTFSLDVMLEMLRLDGFSIGVVIDEAHQNFGTSAKAAAKFYLETLRPDVTLLATATPNDEKLQQFEKDTGIKTPNRLIVSRQEAVDRGLNKIGLKVGLVVLSEKDRDLVDAETAALTAGWQQHGAVKARLPEKGLGVVPLMLVQVEDTKEGGNDPVERVREKLEAIGVPSSVIASHTSGKPDPDFHSIAFDPSREVLIFKVAVATGFDAPRAWTLVSVRPNRGKGFGLQIVGRIMRVHPAVRPFHGDDPLLDFGSVFLTDASEQAGLAAAADELKAVKASIETVTDHLDVYQIGSSAVPLGMSERRIQGLLPPTPTDEDRQPRLERLIEERRVPADVRDRATDEQDRAIIGAEAVRGTGEGDIFSGTLPEQRAPQTASTARTKTKGVRYPLNPTLGLPERLMVERPPTSETYNSAEFLEQVAHEFVSNSRVLNDISRRMVNAKLTFQDIFDEHASRVEEDIRVRLDDHKVVEAGQQAFAFNDSIDQRLLKRAILDKLRAQAYDAGLEFQDNDLRRAMYLAAMRDRQALKESQRLAMAKFVMPVEAEHPIDLQHYDSEDCEPAPKNAYGIYPSDLNGWERAFAELLEADDSGTVRWWLRNPSRAGHTYTGWGTNLILPSSSWFFPDFVIGINGRSTTHEIALAEVKGDNLRNIDSSIEKIRVEHRTYKQVFWAGKDDDKVVRLRYDGSLNRILVNKAFAVRDLRYTDG